MKKTILGLLIVVTGLVTLSFSQSQTDYALARVSKLNNKLVFLWSEPINDYETAITFENKIQNYHCLSPEQVSFESIKNANAEAANQGKIYDAIVTVNGSSRDLAIIWKDKAKDNTIARVKKQEGKLVFVQCEPLMNYEIAGKFNIFGVGQQVLLGTCPTHQQKIDKLLQKASKDRLDFDGVIYGSTKNDLVIKFK
jgi:hypothetical protein